MCIYPYKICLSSFLFLKHHGSFYCDTIYIYNSLLLLSVLKSTLKGFKHLVFILLSQILFVYISSTQTIVVTSIMHQLTSCHQLNYYFLFSVMNKVFLLLSVFLFVAVFIASNFFSRYLDIYSACLYNIPFHSTSLFPYIIQSLQKTVPFK